MVQAEPSPIVTYDHVVHSDFLIHWTGKDIDKSNQPNWYYDDHRSMTNVGSERAYRKRLLDILKYGLWMTSEEGFKIGDSRTPDTPKCCFTELKLSESRRHAYLYGRLGIGVKRPFLFERRGRTLAYFGYKEESNDELLQACARDLKNRELLNFFKPMNSGSVLNYDLYGESEWRLLYLKELKQLLAERKIVDPRDERNTKENAYFRSLTPDEQMKLKFLVALDGWFATIIYPSLTIKNWAQRGLASPVRTEIERIKSRPDRGNQVEGGNWPIEVHLDSCRHF